MMFESAFHPTAQFSSGFADLGVYGTQPLPAPSEYHELVAMDVQVIQSWSFDVQPLIVLGALFLGLATTLAVCIPIAFILLPISRRRAKVRWRHIWRVGVYTSRNRTAGGAHTACRWHGGVPDFRAALISPD